MKYYLQLSSLRFLAAFAGITLFALLCAMHPRPSQQKPASDGTTTTMHWRVDDTDREAVVYIPASAKSNSTPVIFSFHGFGVNMNLNHDQHRFDQYWPEAIIVWPQGLKATGAPLGLPDAPGWQMLPGRDKRDLDFFDTMLRSLKRQYHIDNNRIYATGHSNGGGFTYTLWAQRGDELAAVGPSAAPTIKALVGMIKPKPCIQVTGTADKVVNPQKQLETFNKVKQLNHCSNDGAVFGLNATLYPSATGNPTVLIEHNGGHVLPADEVPVIIKFFKSVKKSN